jgi:hypothetical protein
MVLIPPPRRIGESEEHREIALGASRGGVEHNFARHAESCAPRLVLEGALPQGYEIDHLTIAEFKVSDAALDLQCPVEPRLRWV